MKLALVNAETFNSLSYAEPNASIFQTTNYANYMSSNNYRPVFLQALNDNDTCIGLAMFLLKKKTFLSFKNVAYCPLGYLINYYDKDELSTFDNLVCKYLKEKENVDTIIIEPNITLKDNENGDYLRYTLEHLSYKKINEVDYYEIDIKKFKKYDTNNNLFFNLRKSNDKNVLLQYIDDNKEYLNKYDAYKQYSTLYEISLDSFRSKASLKKNIEENEEYIKEYKDDIKYRESVQEKTKENQLMNNLLQLIAKYEKNYKDNPGLALALVTNYADKYVLEYFVDRDNKDQLFDLERVTINKIIDDLKENKIKKLSSYKQLPNVANIYLIGQYSKTI